MTLKQTLIIFYLDYVNHYLTVEKLAEHYGMSIETTTKLIEVGKSLNENDE